MTYLSARRMLSACVVSAAAVAALAAPGTASATSDLTHQCAGSNIKGLGSTFQAPAQQTVWNVDFNAATDTNVLGCAGNPGQGDLKTPTATYESTGSHAGSGACLKAFGDGEAPKYSEYGYCGTDEAPNEGAKALMEANKEASDKEAKTIETIPVLQGSVAVLIHLPAGCLAKSEIASGAKKVKLGRLALDNSTVERIFRGTIRTWKEAIENQAGDAKDQLTCKGGTAEEETPINVVVRTDKSGTTHIFKSYLAQVNASEEFEAEPFNEISEEGTLHKPCSTALPEELKTWKKIQEGCENQRWPTKAAVVRPFTKGNPGVIKEVATLASSITYADLAAARKEGFFSKKGEGGENTKGTETKVGEQHTRFWAEIQDSATPGATYADPASNGDVEKIANSNCAGTVYAGEPGEKIPPKTTRETWFSVKAELVQKKYNICGLTYDLALREYKAYLQPKTPEEEEASKNEAQTVRDYLLWELNPKAQGGGADMTNHDYEKVTGTVLKEAEVGVKEIGWAVP